MPLVPGSRFDAYELIRPIGSGGMGEVWLATEVHLRRKVALKLLPPDLTRDTTRVTRFQQEARAASALSHPNVCVIHALGMTADGQHYIAMEYVEGRTLRARLVAERLPIRETLEIAIQIASALAAAHAAHIVHRDIKPENVMLRPDGFVKVLDFGLAKLTSVQESDPAQPTQTAFRTDAGSVVGTVAYMSPEQARGQPIDARTDVWSLGVMLYEMVAGRSPFSGQSSSDMLAALLEREPAPLARFDPDTPPELQRIVTKALRKDCAQRYQTAQDLLLDLQALRGELHAETQPRSGGPLAAAGSRSAGPAGPRRSRRALAWTGSAVAVLCLLVLLLGWSMTEWRDRILGARALPEIRSLAVLPLENLSRDAEQDYFADGMTEALSLRLSALKGVRVISRTSVMQFKGGRTPVPEIARALNVDAVVTGSVQRAGGRVRISAQLIRGAVDEMLWSGSFDREMEDVLALQSELAHIIAQQIDHTITSPERTPPSVAPDVYDSYLKGLFELRKSTPASINAALVHFQDAIAQNPTFAPAHLGLGEAYANLGSLAVGSQAAAEVRPRATAAVKRALELDPDLARAHSLLARLQEEDWHWAEAEAAYRRALALDPSLAQAHTGLGWLLLCRGRQEEAIASSLLGRELDPLSPDTGVGLGITLHSARRYEEAVREFRNVLLLQPDDTSALAFLGLALLAVGDNEESVRVLERAVSLSSRNPFYLGMLAGAYAREHRRREAEQIVEELQRRRKAHYVTPGAFVHAFAGLGDDDATLASLEEAYAERANIMKWLKVAPLFDPLRTDPRFVDLVRRVGLD